MFGRNKEKLFQLAKAISILTILAGSAFVVILQAQTREATVELKPESIKPVQDQQKRNRVASSSSLVTIQQEIKIGEFKNNEFNLITDKGDELLVLINKKIGLGADFVPKNLVSIESLIKTYPGAQLTKEAATALQAMAAAAAIDGVDLTVVSAYRSYQEQAVVFNGWVGSAGLQSAENFSARPGHSQHQLGTAVDIGIAGKASFSDNFAASKEGVWLAANSASFGYILSYPKGKESITGYSYEPWHYRYIGKDNARRLVDTNLILEEFLQKYGTW